MIIMWQTLERSIKSQMLRFYIYIYIYNCKMFKYAQDFYRTLLDIGYLMLGT